VHQLGVFKLFDNELEHASSEPTWVLVSPRWQKPRSARCLRVLIAVALAFRDVIELVLVRFTSLHVVQVAVGQSRKKGFGPLA
jgi:hypothetical protein